jgi:hypothetical protein
MSALVELQNRIQSTNALIAEHERAAAESGIEPPRSLLANILALEKLKRRLEVEYLDLAAEMELEVYRYRILNDSERVTFAAVSESWSKFQIFFDSVYASLTQSAKRKGKKPVQPERMDLGYGYSFASSIGVVVTVPREIGFYAKLPIEEASDTVFDLIEAKNVTQIASQLGPQPIRSLHEWIQVHVRNRSGIGLEWRSNRTVKRSAEIQYPLLVKLQERIADTTTTIGLDVTGELFSVDTETKEFKIRGDNNTEYHGTFTEAITLEHAASIPARYKARITETTKIIVLGEEPETSLFLERLTPP